MTDDNRYVDPLTGKPGHFHPGEFANRDGLVSKNTPILSLEQVRADAWDWEEKRQRKARGLLFALLGVRRLDGGHLTYSYTAQAFHGVNALHDSIRAASEVAIVISEFGGVRTNEDNEELARRLGWIGEVRSPNDNRNYPGWTVWPEDTIEAQSWPRGAVSEDSQHLPSQGATAVDIKEARVTATGEVIPQQILGGFCRKRFVYVKDDYEDGHVHADNRDGED